MFLAVLIIKVINIDLPKIGESVPQDEIQ